MDIRFKNAAFLILGAWAAIGATYAAADGSVTGGLNELEGNSDAILTFGSGTNTSFVIGGAYSRLFPDFRVGGILPQATAEASISFISFPIGSVDTFLVKVGPTLNYSMSGTGIDDAIYLRLLIGMAYASNSTSGTTTSGTGFAYTAQLGKRFEPFTNVFWKPAFDMSGTTAAGSNPVFSLIPVQFSFSF